MADTNIGLHWKIWSGDALTPEEQAEWAEYQAAQKTEREQRSLIGLVDMAEILRVGVEPPEMLVEDWLVRGEHHVVFGPYGEGKTWVVLLCAAALLHQQKKVVWVDLETGRRALAERLHALHVTPEAAESLTYLEYPVFGSDDKSISRWRALMDGVRPDLVVIDAQTGALAVADAEENSGTAVAKWQRNYIEPAREAGAAVVIIDHTPISDSGRVVASRQKGAAAKIMFSVGTLNKFGRHHIGAIKVECTKNGIAAEIPEKRTFRIGAEDGRFVFEQTLLPGPEGSGDGGVTFRIRRDVQQRIREAGTRGLRTGQITGLVTGSHAKIINAAKELVADEGVPIRSDPSERGGVLYTWTEASE